MLSQYNTQFHVVTTGRSTQPHSIILSNGVVKVTICRLHGRVTTFYKLTNTDRMAHLSDSECVGDSYGIFDVILMKRDSAWEDVGIPMLLVQRYLWSILLRAHRGRAHPLAHDVPMEAKAITELCVSAVCCQMKCLTPRTHV